MNWTVETGVSWGTLQLGDVLLWEFVPGESRPAAVTDDDNPKHSSGAISIPQDRPAR